MITQAKLTQVPATIWVLGTMSLLLNLSSIMIFSVSPLYLTQVFGLTTLSLGILEGIVEFCSWGVRIVAGVLSDSLRKRKPILLFACALTTLARPIFAIAPSALWVYCAKLLDRLANGFQATPREALVGDIAPSELKGTCYGLRQSLGVIGSLLGAAAVMVLMRTTDGDYQTIFWIASIPPTAALVALFCFVKDAPPEPTHDFSQPEKAQNRVIEALGKIRHLGKEYWAVIAVTAVFMLSNYSGAYRILQAQASGFPLEDISLIMIAQNLGTMLAAYPMGRLSDVIDRRLLLAAGIFLAIISNFFLGFAAGHFGLLTAASLWGAQMGITQSILAAMVADTTHQDLRGTAFGLYYFITALSLFAANSLMGWLLELHGPTAGFMSSATLAAGSLLLIPTLLPGFTPQLVRISNESENKPNSPS